jgi:hypothetical protein
MHYNASYGATYNMSNWKWAVKDTGSNDAIDSDVAGDATVEDQRQQDQCAFSLVSGQNDMTRDAGITPIVIDLDGNGIQTVSRANSAGTFDLFGNGNAVQSGWISGGEGFLAVDKNGNGRSTTSANCLAARPRVRASRNWRATTATAMAWSMPPIATLPNLLIWRDANGNHQTDDGELMTLAEAGVAALDMSTLASCRSSTGRVTCTSSAAAPRWPTVARWT